MPGASPAMFRWQTNKKETKIENLDIGIDQIKLTIESLTNVEPSVLGTTIDRFAWVPLLIDCGTTID